MSITRLCLTIALFATGALPTSAASTFNTVVVNGRPDGDPLGPQLGPGENIYELTQFRMSRTGKFAYAYYNDAFTDGRLWRNSAGTNELLATASAVVPGVPSDLFSDNLLGIADDGTVLSTTFDV